MELNDPKIIELFETSNEIISAMQPGASIADALPILENLPKALQWWRPRGERAFQKCLRYIFLLRCYSQELILVQGIPTRS